MIKCRAIEENSIFMNSYGDVLPCCFVWRADSETVMVLRHFVKKENFDDLSDSWNSDEPYQMCVKVCDENSNNISSIKNFDKQWKIFDSTNNR
jgi:hypothetical protein